MRSHSHERGPASPGRLTEWAIGEWQDRDCEGLGEGTRELLCHFQLFGSSYRQADVDIRQRTGADRGVELLRRIQPN
jgi:hypothetical protein